jgi:NifU-like protein involved in Fe-S cluster formation
LSVDRHKPLSLRWLGHGGPGDKLVAMGSGGASIREHFLAPRNAGRVEPPAGIGRAENAVCGDRLEVTLGVLEERLAAVRYRAEGCSALTATASLVSEHLTGRTLEEARGLDVAGLVERAGGLPPSKAHAPRVVERALRQALADHNARRHP